MFGRTRAISRRLPVWRTGHPDDAALAFDLSVITIGLLLIAAPQFPVEDLPIAPGEAPTVKVSTVPDRRHDACDRQAEASTALAASTVAEDPAKRTLSVSHSVAASPSKSGKCESNLARPATHRLPPVPSPAAFFDGQHRLIAGQTQQACEAFSSLTTAHPNDPTTAYHLAVALYVAGRPDEATAAAVRAAKLERRYGLPGYGWLMERIQGPHRVWLEGIRRPIVQR